VFGYMKKAENFHNKKWFDADKDAHGYDGLLDVEPHDLVRVIESQTVSASNMYRHQSRT
jgi:hypothetical protein